MKKNLIFIWFLIKIPFRRRDTVHFRTLNAMRCIAMTLLFVDNYKTLFRQAGRPAFRKMQWCNAKIIGNRICHDFPWNSLRFLAETDFLATAPINCIFMCIVQSYVCSRPRMFNMNHNILVSKTQVGVQQLLCQWNVHNVQIILDSEWFHFIKSSNGGFYANLRHCLHGGRLIFQSGRQLSLVSILLHLIQICKLKRFIKTLKRFNCVGISNEKLTSFSNWLFFFSFK